MTLQQQQQRSDVGLATALRISVSRLARRLRVERLVPELAEPALSDTQLAALATLERHGAMTPGELAEHEKVQPPSMTRVIAALTDWQLVTRAPHPTDRRQVILTVTQDGRDLVQKVRRRREAWLARRLAELSPQERATLRAAAPILEKLSQS
jgi:DNA-binding MarR family transcriptional regulator